MSVPSQLTSLMFHSSATGLWTVAVYVVPDGSSAGKVRMAVAAGPATDAGESAANYSIQQDLVTIYATSEQITAEKVALVKYPSSGKAADPADQVRLYYITKDGTDYRLREICRTAKVTSTDAAGNKVLDFAGQPWFKGVLSDDLKTESIDEKGPLSATVSGNLIKVFYKSKNETGLRVAYDMAKGGKKWQSKLAVPSFASL